MKAVKINELLSEKAREQVRAELRRRPVRRRTTDDRRQTGNWFRRVVAGVAGRRVVAFAERDKSHALVKEGGLAQFLVDPAGTLHVRITRIGGRELDGDNLAGGCKELRDAIAAAFGRKGDSDGDGFEWEYAQDPSTRRGALLRAGGKTEDDD
jgi:hypothetical protein